jgi:hypothetical protein
MSRRLRNRVITEPIPVETPTTPSEQDSSQLQSELPGEILLPEEEEYCEFCECGEACHMHDEELQSGEDDDDGESESGEDCEDDDDEDLEDSSDDSSMLFDTDDFFGEDDAEMLIGENDEGEILRAHVSGNTLVALSRWQTRMLQEIQGAQETIPSHRLLDMMLWHVLNQSERPTVDTMVSFIWKQLQDEHKIPKELVEFYQTLAIEAIRRTIEQSGGSVTWDSLSHMIEFYTLERRWPSESQLGAFISDQHDLKHHPPTYYRNQQKKETKWTQLASRIQVMLLKDLKDGKNVSNQQVQVKRVTRRTKPVNDIPLIAETKEDLFCALCQQGLDDSHWVAMLPCHHTFHARGHNCLEDSSLDNPNTEITHQKEAKIIDGPIRTWLKQTPTCPVCRQGV